jgi:hypothetical protein
VSTRSSRYSRIAFEASTASGGGVEPAYGANRVANLVAPVDAEELADDGERERAGEAGDEVHRTLDGADAVEELVHELPDAGLQGVEPRPPEGAGGESAQAGVIGRVDAQHVTGQGGAGQPLGHDGPVAVERGEHVLGQVRVVQGLTGCAVADDEEGAVAVGQGHVMHGPFLPDPVEEGERIVAVVGTPGGPGGIRVRGRHGCSRKPEQTRSMRPTSPA